MALFDMDTTGVLWDSVALPNAFIIEYMPTAPENYVKVYIYGLLFARFMGAAEGLTVQALAKELGMEESDVLAAFQYWERARLVIRTQDKPPRFRYLSVQQAMMGRQAAPADDQYREFAQALYAVFGDRRQLHGGETQLCYEWVEQLKLPSEVVLLMVQFLTTTRGVNFSFKAAQKLAAELAERHIVTLEDAEQYFARSQAAWDGTRKVLRRISKFRPPTVDEIDLYLKWTAEWGFAPKAVEAACAEMTGGDPSFKYLDSILRGIHERSGRAETTAAQLEKQLSREKEEGADIRAVLAAAGLSIPATQPAMKDSYQKMLSKLSHGALLLAAREISRSKKNQSLQKLEELVDSWHDKGLKTEDDVKGYLALVKKQNEFLQTLFSSMGAELSPSPADRELLSKWRQTWAFSDEALLEAAASARGANAPMKFLNKVLEDLHAKDIQAPQAVRAAVLAHAADAKNGPRQKRGKTVIEQQYSQREYDPAKVDGLTPEEIEEAMKYDA